VSEPFLVDQLGHALYLFTTDTQNGGSSDCTDECLTQWQPVIVTGTPQAGNGVNASLLGAIPQDGGTLQATYNGWPLYTYTGDAAPGNIHGQGMNGAWFLVSGTGNAIQ
jgi:predicted lipoprotein with Yx(FWY)xxD motif